MKGLLQDDKQSPVPFEELAKHSFIYFARGLAIPSASGPQLLDDAMLSYEQKGIAPFQRKFFEDVDPSLRAIQLGGIPPVRRFWMERTKKGSKDTDIAVCILWLMAYAKRPLLCQIVAADRDQAAIIKRRCEETLFYNEWLEGLVEVQRNKIISKSRLGETVIEATDTSGSHGETPDLLVLNELVHVSKWDVMETHYNNASGVPRGVVIVATNAGFKGTKAEKWRNNALAKGRWHVHLWKDVAPWLMQEDINDVRVMNTRSEYFRLFKGRWVTGKGDALSEEALESVFVPGLIPMYKPEPGWAFVGGLDLGVSHDHAGLAIVGVNSRLRKIRCCLMKDFRPSIPNDKGVLEVDIQKVMRAVQRTQEAFSVAWYGYDPAAGGSFLAQQLRQLGVYMREMRFTDSSLNEMAISFMKVIGSGVLESYEHEAFRRDLGKFHIERRPPSGYRLKAVSDEFGHADVGTAVLIALPKAIEILGGLSYEEGGFKLMSAEDVEGMDDIQDEDMIGILAASTGDDSYNSFSGEGIEAIEGEEAEKEEETKQQESIFSTEDFFGDLN